MSSVDEKRKRESPKGSGDEGESPQSSDDEADILCQRAAKRACGGRFPRVSNILADGDRSLSLIESRKRTKTIKEMIAELRAQPKQSSGDLQKIEAVDNLLQKDARRTKKLELMIEAIEAIQAWNDRHPEAMDSESDSSGGE